MRRLICSYLLILSIVIIPAKARAHDYTGASYQGKHCLVALSGPGAASGSYDLKNIVGVNVGTMRGSLYGMTAGLPALNSLPLAVISNYNNAKRINDETPTLRWLYSDADNDTQKRYQLQVGRGGFGSLIADTGIVSSAASSYTTSILPLTEGRTAFQWRVRVDDGFGWSGWNVASSGFTLEKEGFFISGLQALTAPGGEAIEQASWQKDNDPYFYWDPPRLGIEILGYSYSLDELPDEKLSSVNNYYYFAQDDITEGAHTFYVKAQRSSGVWGDVAEFNIWVDSVAPTVSNLTPTLGGVISKDQPEVRAVLSDGASGVNPETIEMKINQARVSPEYNPETGTISFTPSIPFSEGEIIISLEVADRVGNDGLPLSWSFIIDTEGPTGTMLINNGDELTSTNVVTLNISAQDDVTAIAQLMLSNDGVFDTETWETYVALRKNWVLPAINGRRKVYAKLKDEAGNISEVFFDEINLVIVAPDTYVITGPSGITQLADAQFTFRGSLDGCQFSYKFDNEDWSDWSQEVLVKKAGLLEGNHYFTVKAAKDLNKDGLLQVEEVDPTPALRTWTISTSGLLKPSPEPEKPVKRWEEE